MYAAHSFGYVQFRNWSLNMISFQSEAVKILLTFAFVVQFLLLPSIDRQPSEFVLIGLDWSNNSNIRSNFYTGLSIIAVMHCYQLRHSGVVRDF